MAIIDEPRIELERAKVVTPVEALGVFARPTSDTGWRSWVTTVDHKKIGIMYGATALFFFVVGGVEALLIRLQLARPNGTILARRDRTTRSSRCTAPRWCSSSSCRSAAAFVNYLMPLQIGARDVAFPRLNMFSYWCFLFGGLFLNSSWFLGGAPDGGWFGYAPNTSRRLLAGPRHRLLGLGLHDHRHRLADRCRQPHRHHAQHAGAGHDADASMPVFTWMSWSSQFLLLFAMPVITVALFLLHVRPATSARTSSTCNDGRRPAAVAAPVLDLRPPRGVHPHPARLRHRLRDPPGVLAQAALRLPVRGVLGHRHRLHGLGRVGAPHVRLRHRPGLGRRVLAVDDVHRRADRREDLQLARHDVGRPAAVHDADAVRDRPRRACSPSAACRA